MTRRPREKEIIKLTSSLRASTTVKSRWFDNLYICCFALTLRLPVYLAQLSTHPSGTVATSGSNLHSSNTVQTLEPVDSIHDEID